MSRVGVVVPKKGHHFETNVVDDSWQSFSKVLIDSETDLETVIREIYDRKPPMIGFDTETTSKDFNTLQLVGCSLAWEFDVGFYFPFGHQVGKSLPPEGFGDLWEAVHRSARLIPAYNKRFDYRVVRKDLVAKGRVCPGPWESKMFEVASVVWNADTDRWGPRAKLKTIAKDVLGWNLDSFEKTLGEVKDMSWKDPTEVVVYAAMDSIILINLLNKLRGVWQERRTVVDLDDQMTTALIEVEDEFHPIDIEFCEWALQKNREDSAVRLEIVKDAAAERLAELSRHGVKFGNEADLRTWAAAEFRRVHDVDLERLNLNSTKEMPKFFAALGLDTGEKTPGGKVSFSAKALQAMEDAGTSDAVLKKVIDYRKSEKNVGYLDKFVKEGSANRGVRCAYNTTKVTTGRLSASKSEGNSYFYSASIHTVKKAKKIKFLAVPGTDILGYDFLPLSKDGAGRFVLEDGRVVGEDVDGIVVEGRKRDHTNIRRALCAKEGHLFVHIDYNAEEVRILGNIARDESIEKPFAEGKDPHSQTVVDLFGRFMPDKREMCKGINFLSSYGGSAFTLAQKVGIPKAEAEVYINKWWAVRAGVRRWKGETLDFALKNGYVETAFGRIRWVDYLLMSPEFWERKAGERLCLNSPIQGTGGDLLRLVVVKLQRNVAPKYGADFQLLSTVHDEVNCSVAEARFDEIRRAIVRQMDVTLPGWRIPMVAEFEVGHSWGNTFKFEFPEDGPPYPRKGEE